MTADTPVGGDRDAVAEALQTTAALIREHENLGGDPAVRDDVLLVLMHRQALLARAEAAEARVKELEAALEPFRATLASINRGEAVDDATPLNHPALWSHDQPTLGDLRRLCSLPPVPEVSRA